METRAKSWHFATILKLPPEVEHSIACNSHISEDVVKRVLKSQILNGLRPDPIFSVQVRYKLSDLRNPSSELPLNGYVQSKQKLAGHMLLRWFRAQWSPVGGHCSRSPEYIKFCQHDTDYVCLSLLEKPARNKGGRPSKKKRGITLVHSFMRNHAAESHSNFRICAQLQLHNLAYMFTPKCISSTFMYLQSLYVQFIEPI
jgi:hypothetical protein